VLFALAVVGLFAVYVAVALYFVWFGRINHDEGWYLYASRLVYEGSLPYRDFAYFQAPLLPFVYGLPQKLFGIGITTGRLTSFVLGAGVVVLAARLAFERGGRWATVFTLAMSPLTPLVVWSWTTTRTEPLVGFLLMASAYMLSRRSRSVSASGAALFAAVLAAGTRISALPALGLVALFVIFRHRRSTSDLARVLVPGAIGVSGLLWVAFASSLDVAWFNTISVQADRHNQLQTAEALETGRFLLRRLRDLAVLHVSFGVVPVFSLACALGASFMWFSRTPGREGGSSSAAGFVAALAALGLAAYLPNLMPQVVWPGYFAAVFPLFLVVVACAAGSAFTRADAAGRKAIVAGSAALLLFQGAIFAREFEGLVSRDSPDLAELRAVARQLAEEVPAGRRLLTLDTYLAAESGLDVPSGFEMGLFAHFPSRSESDGRRLHILTEDRLSESLRSASIGAVVLSDRALGVLLKRKQTSYRFHRKLTEAELHSVLPELKRYRLDRVVPEFGQFGGNLYVLFPDEPESR
jgi:hypothetical protein